jgi:hypothetical protein
MVVAALFAASPAVQSYTVTPQTDPVTEFSILGPNHNATYPYNITSGTDYQLYLDINNHLGVSAYYQIQVKFRNQTQSAPDSFNHTNSQQPSLGNISLFAANEETIELPLQVSLQYTLNPDDLSLNMQYVYVNGARLDVDSTVITWDSQRAAFFGNLIFELYIYNAESDAFQYHQRFVSLWLLMMP